MTASPATRRRASAKLVAVAAARRLPSRNSTTTVDANAAQRNGTPRPLPRLGIPPLQRSSLPSMRACWTAGIPSLLTVLKPDTVAPGWQWNPAARLPRGDLFSPKLRLVSVALSMVLANHDEVALGPL